MRFFTHYLRTLALIVCGLTVLGGFIYLLNFLMNTYPFEFTVTMVIITFFTAVWLAAMLSYRKK